MSRGISGLGCDMQADAAGGLGGIILRVGRYGVDVRQTWSSSPGAEFCWETLTSLPT